jgi:ubiquitin fusion degradation protein 1
MEEGQLISVKNVSLAKATFVKFRAQNVDFLEISNHRAVLEVTLRKFTCLSEGDQICISHSGKLYYLDVREVKPNGAASIIETDCDVDFEEPVGYQDSHYAQYEKNAAAKNEQKSSQVEVVRTLQKAREVTPDELAAKNNVFKPFGGDAKRIDGRLIAADKESKDGKDNKESKDSKSSKGSSSSSATASSTSYSAKDNTAFTDKLASTTTAPPAYQSRIGDKFSKKKSALTALTDPGQKFAGAANKLN